MKQSAFKKLRSPFLAILLLFIFSGGCSSPANTQKSASYNSSNKYLQTFSDKTSDLSGLWLLPQIDALLHKKVQSRGFTLSQKEIYDPQNPSLNQAITKIKVGNSQVGTGSFVSPDGLLVTNYNSAIQGIAQNSTTNHNYLHNGFSAESQEQEIPLKNYNLLITIEQKEVTDQINQQLADSLTFRQQKKQTQQIKKQLIAERQSGKKNVTVEINDTWGGNRQFMSVFKVIRDVRLVHAPPNPDIEHSTNYTFLRAYVTPTGQSKPYSKTNVPFRPKKHLQIATNQPNFKDVTLTLGFPGETQRYESSFAIKFYEEYRNPILINTYKTILNATKYAARKDSTKAIETAPILSSLNHNLTYYQALQEGVDKHNIITRKQTEEEKFEKWIKQDSLRSIRYRRVLNQLEQSYRIASQTGDLLFALVNTINNSKLLQIAGLYNSYYQHIRDSANTEVNETNKRALLEQHRSILSEINIEAQTMMLEDMIYLLATLPEGKVPFHLIELFGTSQDTKLEQKIKTYLEKQRSSSIIFDLRRAEQFLSLPADSILNHPKDELTTLYEELLNSYQFSHQNYSQHIPYLQPAQELYVKGLLEFRDDSVTNPDANGTLRLSIGQIKKLQKGKLNKSDRNSTGDYVKMRNFATTNDMTGGSLGSPMLNKNGKLIGIIVKRSPQSMSNDLFYMPELSHTVNLNIQHIISRIAEMYNNSSLLKEMHILDNAENRQ